MGAEAALLALFTRDRDYWDAGDNTPRATRSLDTVVGFEMHHTGGAGPKSLSDADKTEWLLSIERYHEQTKGWSDIFYNVFVFGDGEIWEGRRADRSSQASVSEYLTVHIPGNSPKITDEQHSALLALARWATNDTAMVRGHSDRASTACPGDSGRAELKRIRAELEETIMELQNLGKHGDAVAAKELGLWDGSNPAMGASRSVVSIVAFRAYEAAVVELLGKLDALAARVAAIESAPVTQGPVGPRGPKGAKGAKGDAGLRGPAGVTGPQGITGLADIIKRLS